MEIKGIVKAPHYFLVHFNETFTSVEGGHASGKAYIIFCDNVATNVYGFKSEEEVKNFDPLKLRSFMRGSRTKKELWGAKNETELMPQINNDPRIKAGVYVLNNKAKHGAIENLPECKRMHINTKGDLLCGKPVNSDGDGCCGGCVLQGYDQDEPFGDGSICPMHTYWDNQFAKVMAE